MRPGPATQTAFLREFPLKPVTARRRNDRFSPTALESSATFAKASCRSVTLRSRIHNRAVGQRLCPASRSEERRAEWGSRPQRPGQPVRARARFLDSPPAIHPRESPGCRWPCRNHSASSGTLTFSVHPLSARWLRLATEKLCAVVKKLCRTYLPCGSPRKTEN